MRGLTCPAPVRTNGRRRRLEARRPAGPIRVLC
jgi:hypothetical protein